MAQAWHRGGKWVAVRQTILERDRHTCQIGGEHCITRATHVDHIISPAEGGAWYDPTNLRAACEPCNLRRPRPRLRKSRDMRPEGASRDW